jgi:hypothetical protein
LLINNSIKKDNQSAGGSIANMRAIGLNRRDNVSQGGGEWECEDCGVDYPQHAGTSSANRTMYCTVCGSQLKRKQNQSTTHQQDEQQGQPQQAAGGPETVFGLATREGDGAPGLLFSDAMLQDDLLSGLFGAFAGMLQSRNSQSLSKSYLKTLGKVILDDKLTVLHDVTLNFGSQLRFSVVPATFSWLPPVTSTSNVSLSGTIVWANPIHGESPLVTSTEEADSSKVSIWHGAIVLFMRGKVSFATKYYHAVAAGAAAVIVCQTFDMWPFVMGDSANELPALFPGDSNGENSPNVPVVMISKQDTEDLQEMLNQANSCVSSTDKRHHKSAASSSSSSPPCSLSSSASSVHAVMQFHPMITECVICADNFAAGQEVVKLPCRHVFHCECVFTWLDKHSTCPICRKLMPSETAPAGASNSSSAGGDTSRQQYFV